MLYAIDGIPVPQRTGIQHFKSTFGDMPRARFILDHLNPDSVIGWMDFETTEAPTYEGLMMWARMILPGYVRRVKHPGSLEMRRACKELTGNFVPVATHVTGNMLDMIYVAIKSKKAAGAHAMRKLYPKGNSLVLDSLGSHYVSNEDFFKSLPLDFPTLPLNLRNLEVFKGVFR